MQTMVEAIDDDEEGPVRLTTGDRERDAWAEAAGKWAELATTAIGVSKQCVDHALSEEPGFDPASPPWADCIAEAAGAASCLEAATAALARVPSVGQGGIEAGRASWAEQAGYPLFEATGPLPT